MADISNFQKTKDTILICVGGLMVIFLADMNRKIDNLSNKISSELPLMEYRIKTLEEEHKLLPHSKPNEERKKEKTSYRFDGMLSDNRYHLTKENKRRQHLIS
jgi:hypothetical protein